jgi:hypothetical protein
MMLLFSHPHHGANNGQLDLACVRRAPFAEVYYVDTFASNVIASDLAGADVAAIDPTPIVNEPRHLPRSSISVIACISSLPAHAAIASGLFSEPAAGWLS